jgi:hypothetical protein
MGMFNLSQPYSGNFYEAEYLEYDETTKKFKVPILIKYKPKTDSSQGVSTTVKERIRVNEGGRWVEKNVFTIQVVENLKYKLRDKIRILNEDKAYVIFKVGDGVDSINSITNLMFPNSNNIPHILYLGDD